MVRSAPGAGDREVLAELARRGLEPVVPSRLEYWRRGGVLQRTVVERLDGYGSISTLAGPVGEIADQVEAIRDRAWPGRPLEVTAVALAADGFWCLDDALRAGHRRNLAAVDTTLNRLLGAGLAAWSGARPRTGLAKAEAVADWLVQQPGKVSTAWRRNLRNTPAVLGGEPLGAVLTSGVTAAVQLIMTGWASDGGLFEFVTATGWGQFAEAIGAADKGRDPDAPRDTEESAALVGPLIRTPAMAGRTLSRLPTALDVPADHLRAAAVVVVAIWEVLERVPALAAMMRLLPVPTSANPQAHTVAVAMLMANTIACGIDVEPFVAFAHAHGLLNTERAHAVRRAGVQLADAYPPPANRRVTRPA